MDVLIIALITLAIYSIIGTIAFLVSKENETVAIAFGLGFVGLTVAGLAKLAHALRNRFKYHIGKRAIFEDAKTKQRFKCKPKDATTVFLAGDYKFIRRYAQKSEWKDLPDISKEYIEKARLELEIKDVLTNES